MASEFDDMLAEWTKKGEAKVHGAIMKCVDKDGKEIYSKIAGYDSLSDDAAPLREDAVLKVASATKLITSIALLQCIERGLIGLDEPVAKFVPELDAKELLYRTEDGKLASRPSTVPITARHLLSHTSGLGYIFLDPLLVDWGKETSWKATDIVTHKYSPPLVYEPGNGWAYGSSLDWAGVVIRRLNNETPLEKYFIDNIWKPLGLSAPFPTFSVSSHPEYKARLMQGAEPGPDGKLQPAEWPHSLGENLPDQEEGGAGLVVTTADYMAVLKDLISDSPKLLRPETIASMFEPQFTSESPAMPMLIALRPAWDIVAGPVQETGINHGLGGMLVLDEVPEIGQPGNLLAWGGATNIIWFISRDLGVAGFFATQQMPFGRPKELVDAWKKDFWSRYRAS